MLKLTRKFVALLLALMMTVSTVTVPALAEETNSEVMVTATPVPVEEPAEEPTEETVEVVIEELTEEPVEESIEESTEEPVEESVEESAEEPVEESIEESTEEPVEEPAEEPTEESTEESTEKSTEEPIEESTEENEAAPVTMTLTANAAYAFVGRDVVVLTVTVAGGTAPYTVSMKEDGVEIQSIVVEAEGSIELTYAPAAYGEHVVEVAVADAAEQIASGNVTVIAAESDSETEAEWTEAFENLALSGDWREDIVAIANTQVGYRESERDFVIKEDGEKQGYTRYGDWYGADYSEWCAMFVSFCLNYAEIPEADFPREKDCADWKDLLERKGAYADDENEYEPKAGDLVFFNFEGKNAPQHVGIVERVSGGRIYTIEGNRDKAVQREEYKVDDDAIVGYADMEKLMADAGVLEEEPEMQTEVETEAAAEVQEEVPAEVQTEETAEAEPEVQAEAVIAYTAGENINMRSAASTDSEIVACIEVSGSEVAILGEEDNGDAVWYLAEYGEYTGYIRSDLLKTAAEPMAVQEDAAEQDAEENAAAVVGYTAAENVNMRQQPTTDSAVVICIAASGEELSVVESCEVNGEVWYAVIYDGYEGYIRSDLVAVGESGEVNLLLDDELLQWIQEVDATEEMIARAMNAKSLDSLVIEGSNVVHVRSGAVVAYFDAETGYMTDAVSGIVVARVDMETGMVFPVE